MGPPATVISVTTIHAGYSCAISTKLFIHCSQSLGCLPLISDTMDFNWLLSPTIHHDIDIDIDINSINDDNDNIDIDIDINSINDDNDNTDLVALKIEVIIIKRIIVITKMTIVMITIIIIMIIIIM